MIEVWERSVFVPVCSNCQQNWSWKQTIKESSAINTEMICPYCDEKQYQTKKSKAFAPFSALIVLLPLLVYSFVNVKIPVVILLGSIPILVAIVFLLYPFLIKLSNEEDAFHP